MKAPTQHDRQKQALHAWPPSDEHLGGAIYFTVLALHRMAQADPDGAPLTWAEKCLEKERQIKTGAVHVTAKESP